MAKTQAERAKVYREKRRQAVIEECDVVEIDCDGNVTKLKRDASVTTVTKRVADLPAEAQAQIKQDMDATIQPLDVYSESRWKYLQSRGHVWDTERQCSVRPDGVVGVPVPGDPGYQGRVSVTEAYAGAIPQ